MTESDFPTEEDWRARAQAAEAALSDAERSATRRLVQSELKAEALRAGMIDIDGVKLVDTTQLALSDTGELIGVDSLMNELKRSKPWLFGKHSSSIGATAPPAKPLQPRLATEMTHAEWQAARSEMIKRR